jgi:nitroimidazol reductase NimA-like FMN-containing flavoprotein (pyridoxamine 5'-phosphate oxidase superfamily)
MRRREKEITDINNIERIILKAKVCHLGLSLNDTPYVVPLSFGYKENVIYFHSAKQGKKIDILMKNNKVCFEFDVDHELVKAEKGCEWGMKFRSVIGSGKAYFIKSLEGKQKALNIIMQNYSDKTFEFGEKQLNNTLVGKIHIDQITGKKSGY